jgi:hypothetical protein
MKTLSGITDGLAEGIGVCNQWLQNQRLSRATGLCMVIGRYYFVRCSKNAATGPVIGCRNCPIIPPGTGLTVPYFTGQRSFGKCQVPNNRSKIGVCAV